jgi:L-threonylcarbamoyladenylate synthase
MMAVHYAPVTQAMLCPSDRLPKMIGELTLQIKKIGILGLSRGAINRVSTESGLIRIIRMPEQAEDYAQALYASLRELDNLHLDMILVEQPPRTEAWRTINDRVCKATSSYQSLI